MFDVGFSELMVIAVVALLVLGPERLPKVARTAGHLLGRLQRYVNDVKADINREMQLDELRKMQQQIADSARDFETSVNKELVAVETEVNQSIEAVTRPPLAEAPAQPAADLRAASGTQPAAAGETAPPRELANAENPALRAGRS
ncbi:MAG: Sec-independent protein translocase subunit TatB [Sterolibacteriaceae bacterium]|nr:Sec-independent protein translocase subunit TatB [Candidatus Methylophosphatis haderslevensis]